MKNAIGTVLFLAAFVLATAQASAATKVFLLAGQSNMAGVGGYDSPIPSPYNVSQPAVRFWNDSNDGWVDLQSGFGFAPTYFGPEVSFGYRLHSTIFPNDDIYLVKYALTSTSLAVDWKPDGSGPCYNMFKSRVNTALARLRKDGLSPTIAGMIWMQGEGDATEAFAPAYAANLTNLIGKVRSDFASPDMPFVLGRILPTAGLPTNNAIVRIAQEAVPGQVGNASWINTDDLPLAYPVHYGTQGQIELGIRFADQFVQTPEPSSLVLSGTGVVAASVWACRKRLKKGDRHLTTAVLSGT
jgi:hypothetical protein